MILLCMSGDSRTLRRFRSALIFAILFMFSSAAALAVDMPKRILFLSSYSPSFPTFFRQIQGVRDSFADFDVELDVEFMDSKRFATADVRDRFLDLLSLKLSGMPPYDGVITADDNALRFVQTFGEELFGPVPVVFFGVNDRENALAQNENPRCTGVVESVSMEETIELILKLFPSTEKIYAVSDVTVSGSADLETFLAFSDRYPLDYFSLKDMNFPMLGNRVAELEEGSVILLLSAYHDRDDITVGFSQGLRIIRDRARVPLFHLWYHGMGEGIFGGKLISQYEQASRASEMMIRILFGGESPAEIPVLAESPNVYQFDYRELERFGIARRSLPPGSEIINAPLTIWSQYRGLILAVGAVFFAGSVLVLLLILNIRRSRAYARRLEASEQRLHNLFEYSPVAMIEEDYSQVWDYLQQQLPHGTNDLPRLLHERPELITECLSRVRVLDANRAAVSLYETDGKEPLLEGLKGVLTEESVKVFTDALLTMARGNPVFRSAGPAQTVGGKPVWLRVNLAVAPSMEKVWDRVYVTLEDVTRTMEISTRLEESLQEKEMLLREVHHRVNNNLAMIISFLNLESMRAVSPQLVSVLTDSISRIKAMALVHRRLYRSVSLSSLDVSGYLEELVRDIIYIHNNRGSEIQFSVSCEKLNLERERLVPLGLMVNEIVANSVKHAFDGNGDPRIAVDLTLNGDMDLLLTVRDNGRGIREEDLAAARDRQSLGMMVIESLAAQLGASISRCNDDGAVFAISIPFDGTFHG
jgi:two-component sensor histidine kinase/PAS domain-containing protein